MAVHSENYISLYSGGGGLDLGFRLANPDARPILYVEREFQAAALLVDHIEAGLMERAPVWSDTGTIDCAPFVDRVDWIIGGFPCQPWSVAGARAATDDERWLWPHIERLVREIRPRGIFVENVPGLFHGGIEHVLGGMASLGFDAEWISVRAADVGAPHRRERAFIMARSRVDVTEGSRARIQCDNDRTPVEKVDSPEHASVSLVDADQQGFPFGVWQRSDDEALRTPSREATFPPGPGEQKHWAEILAKSPGLAPAVESPFRGVADGSARSMDGLSRVARLRILGNGVVPQQAAFAFEILSERFEQ